MLTHNPLFTGHHHPSAPEFFPVSSPPLQLQEPQITHPDSKAEEAEEPNFNADLMFCKTPSLPLQHTSQESNLHWLWKSSHHKVSRKEQLGVRKISGKKPNRKQLCKPSGSNRFPLQEGCPEFGSPKGKAFKCNLNLPSIPAIAKKPPSQG